MRFKRPISCIIILAILVSNMSNIFASDTDWRSAYTNWLLSQPPQQAVSGQMSAVLLCDLDFDGIPELFWGGTMMGFSAMKQAWTYKNGKMSEIKIKSPSDYLFVSNIQGIQLYRKKGTSKFLFLSPSILTHLGCSNQSWGTLQYDGKQITVNDPIYSIKTSVEVTYDDKENEQIDYPEIGWTFKDKELDKKTFYDTLNQYLAEYQYIEKPTLWALEFPDTYFEPEIQDVKKLGSLWSQDGKEWNKKTLQSFVNLWIPKIVLGEVSAQPNKVKIHVKDEITTLDTYNIFGNNYTRLRDFAKLMSGTEKNFNVIWNEDKKCVNIITGEKYSGGSTPNMEQTRASATYSTQTIQLNNIDCAITSYIINGNNFVRLRDIAEKIGVTVNWDEAAKVIYVK